MILDIRKFILSARLILTTCVALATQNCFAKPMPTSEIERTNYSIEDVYRMVTKPLSESSKTVFHPSPKYPSDSGYSYFAEKFGRKEKLLFNIGEKFDGDSEYRFPLDPKSPSRGGVYGVRFFRNKNHRIQIVSLFIHSPTGEGVYDAIAGAMLEGGTKVIRDNLDLNPGYILLSHQEMKNLEESYLLIIPLDETHYISSDISKKIIKRGITAANKIGDPRIENKHCESDSQKKE